jgi:hypothetical protein
VWLTAKRRNSPMMPHGGFRLALPTRSYRRLHWRAH